MDSLIKNAFNGGYAIPQFNINNLEWVKYILEACNDYNSPVILGVSEGAIKYMGGYNVVAAMVKAMIQDLNIIVPVTLHLDHASTFLSCKKAIDAGFTSVMIDASKYPYEENVKITKEVVNYASKNNVSVEAEIGLIQTGSNSVDYVDIDEAIKFYHETSVLALAPSLGSVHGIYCGKPNLNYDNMKKLKENKVLFVLHGASGLSQEDLSLSVSNGVCKVNINTDLQIAWAGAVKDYISANPEVYDPRKIIASGEQALKDVVYNKIKVLGSLNRA